MNALQKISSNPSIFDAKAEFKFSTELKHTGVTVVSDKIIKSVEAYNYHFGLLEPSVEEASTGCTVGFKINQNSSNWLGVGMVYKKIAEQNSFQFNYSSLGHGAYLVSCNGGTFCSINRFMVVKQRLKEQRCERFQLLHKWHNFGELRARWAENSVQEEGDWRDAHFGVWASWGGWITFLWAFLLQQRWNLVYGTCWRTRRMIQLVIYLICTQSLLFLHSYLFTNT